MRDNCSSPWGSGWGPVSGSGGRARAARVPNADLRVSDSERNEVAEALSKHFADGRLDQSEFDERMGNAMGAKTRADLSGLLVDLPPLPSALPPQQPVHRRRSRIGLLLLAWFVFMATVGSLAWHVGSWRPHAGWFVVVLLVAFVLSRRSRWARCRYRYERQDGVPPWAA